MKPFVFTEKKGILIIDVRKTLYLFEKACNFVTDRVGRNEKVLFVGTKRQAQDIIKENAERVEMPYVNYRWLGGTLTNFATISMSIEKLKNLEEMKNEGSFSVLSKKEETKLLRDMEKMKRNLYGLRNLDTLPGILFVVDPKKEKTAVSEARKLGIPVIAVIDTNCDPEGIDFPIPANDDAVKSIKIFVEGIADACWAGIKLRHERQSMEAMSVYSSRVESPKEVVILPDTNETEPETKEPDNENGGG